MTDAANGQPAGKWIAGLNPEMPLEAALEPIFRQRWEPLLRAVPLAVERSDEDIEHVHQLRVASRRMSAVLDLLAALLPADQRERLRKQVGRARRLCGKARDLDVWSGFLESMLPESTGEELPGLQGIRQELLRRRKRVQKKLRRKLPDLGRKMERTGHELLAAIPPSSTFDPSGFLPVSRAGARFLLRELNELWSCGQDELHRPQALHRLRIACKRFRYAAEVFAPLVHESFREEFYPQLQHIQDLLGEIHDALAADERLKRDRRRWQKRRSRKGKVSLKTGRIAWRDLRRGIDAVRHAYAMRADHAKVEFFDLWPAFAGDAFRVPLEELLETMAAEAAKPQAGRESSVCATPERVASDEMGHEPPEATAVRLEEEAQ